MSHQIDYMNKCIFCDNIVQAFSRAPEFSDEKYVNINCPRCNKYSFHGSAKQYFTDIYYLETKQKLIISNEIFNNLQIPKLINDEVIKAFDKLQDKDILIKRNLLLEYLCDNIKTELEDFNSNEKNSCLCNQHHIFVEIMN
jgi:DNA-directed RNA polymerase subunit RPC12/RpoP